MSLLEQMKEQLLADIDTVMERKEPSVPSGQYEARLRKVEKEVRRIQRVLTKQREVQDYFEREYDHANVMVAKRKKQLDVASAAGDEELTAIARKEIQEYTRLAEQFEESYDDQVNRVKNLEQKSRELHFLRKSIRREQLDLHAREEETRLEKNMRAWLKGTEEAKDMQVHDCDQLFDEKPGYRSKTKTFDERMNELQRRVNEERNAE